MSSLIAGFPRRVMRRMCPRWDTRAAGARAIAEAFKLVLAAIAVTFIGQGLIAGLAHGRIRPPSG